MDEVHNSTYPVWLGGGDFRRAILFASSRCCEASESIGLGFLIRSCIILEARTAETSELRALIEAEGGASLVVWRWGLCWCSNWSLIWCSLDLLLLI